MTVPPPATWRGGWWGLGQKREFGAGGEGEPRPRSYVPAGLCGRLCSRVAEEVNGHHEFAGGGEGLSSVCGATGKAGKTRGNGHRRIDVRGCKSFTDEQLKS